MIRSNCMACLPYTILLRGKCPYIVDIGNSNNFNHGFGLFNAARITGSVSPLVMVTGKTCDKTFVVFKVVIVT